MVDLDKIEPFIQDVFDLIEFANGDENSEWGRKRAEMGHKEPFNLEYIGIGNEQWGDEYFYKEPEWFLNNINRYDNYDRTLPKVFIGEYAVHLDADKNSPLCDRKNNWYSALAEAAFLTGAERNSDHVVMTCYAPLLAKTNHQQWQPDLIWFDNDSVYGSPNYYIQKLFSEYLGEYSVDYCITAFKRGCNKIRILLRPLYYLLQKMCPQIASAQGAEICRCNVKYGFAA